MVFFEAPHRLDATLAAMADALRRRPAGGGLPRADQDLRGGPPRAAWRELAAWAAEGVRGEITVVVGGRAAEVAADPDDRAAGPSRSGSPRASGSRT